MDLFLGGDCVHIQFIQEVGTDVSWNVFSAWCWNLALVYFGWDIIKWFDLKCEKIFRRLKSNERGF